MRSNQAWLKLDDPAVAGYQITRNRPAEERYGLAGRLRRAALSAADIAEGSGRGCSAELACALPVVHRAGSSITCIWACALGISLAICYLSPGG